MLVNINGMAVVGIDSKKIAQKGITLIEALISTAIVGIGFIAVFQMVNYSVTSIDVSGERTKSNYLSSMIAEDLIGDRFSEVDVGGQKKKIYEYFANNTKTKNKAWNYTPSLDATKKCKTKTGDTYATNDYSIKNKEVKWEHRFSKVSKCRGTEDFKELKVFETCKNGVKVDGKARTNCHYRNDDIWDKTYIGRMESRINKGKKKKVLYFLIQ